jgi:hypothetical protein
MTGKTPQTSQSIDELIATHHHRYSRAYGGGLSDHAPMVLQAMRGLDLPEAAVREFAEYYLAKLEPIEPPQIHIDAGNYAEFVGKRDQYPALLEFFLDEVRRDGRTETVNRYLPGLLSAWASAAFHPLIRLGYGLEFAVDGEVAAGLAYASCLGPHPELARRATQCATRDPVDPMSALLDLQLPPDFETQTGWFHARYSHALGHAVFDQVHPPAGGLPAVAAACREVFAASHNFFALHLVTGSHALRVCLEHLYETPPEIDALTICAVVAAYLAVGAPEFSATEAHDHDAPSFDSVGYLVRTRDEHDIKLAYSCAAQARAYDDLDYLAAARGYLAAKDAKTA